MVREYDFFIFLIVNIVSDALGRGDILLLLLGVISQKNWDNASDGLSLISPCALEIDRAFNKFLFLPSIYSEYDLDKASMNAVYLTRYKDKQFKSAESTDYSNRALIKLRCLAGIR
jgi:hypothetical protein